MYTIIGSQRLIQSIRTPHEELMVDKFFRQTREMCEWRPNALEKFITDEATWKVSLSRPKSSSCLLDPEWRETRLDKRWKYGKRLGIR